MSSIQRLVKMPRDGSRPHTIRDLDDEGATIFAERDTWRITPPTRKSRQVGSSQRYAGSRAIGESHDNGSVGATFVVVGATAAEAHLRVAELIADSEEANFEDLYIEWRPDGGVLSTFYEIRGPAT